MNKPQRLPDYRLEKMDDELLLFNPTKNKIMYCNDTASLIWELCDGERTAQEIAALLAGAYPESASAIAGDVDATLKQFQENGAIEFV